MLDPGFPLIKRGYPVLFTDLSDHAADLLASAREAKELFYGLWCNPKKPLHQITPQEVLAHLDGLLPAPAEVPLAAT